MKDLVVLPPHYNHLWESVRMKIDTTLDRIQEMVMDSHLKAAKEWCNEMAASMAELMLNIRLRNDVNSQLRNSEFYPPQPELAEAAAVTTSGQEENLLQSSWTEDSRRRTELEVQKLKENQEVMAAQIKELTENQRMMQEQNTELLQNQQKPEATMNTMRELPLKLQKP